MVLTKLSGTRFVDEGEYRQIEAPARIDVLERDRESLAEAGQRVKSAIQTNIADRVPDSAAAARSELRDTGRTAKDQRP